jgi:hypothetical protein
VAGSRTWGYGALRPGDGQAVTRTAPSQVFLPEGACWLNRQEGWWWSFRRAAWPASLHQPHGGTLAAEVATCQLQVRARPWAWGRPRPSPRYRRRVLTYRI